MRIRPFFIRRFSHLPRNQPLASPKPRAQQRLIPMVRKSDAFRSADRRVRFGLRWHDTALRFGDMSPGAGKNAQGEPWTLNLGLAKPRTIHHELFFYLSTTRRYPRLRADTRRLPRYRTASDTQFRVFRVWPSAKTLWGDCITHHAARLSCQRATDSHSSANFKL